MKMPNEPASRKITTTLIFQDKTGDRTEILKGGFPLSKGESVHVLEDGRKIEYTVIEKVVEYRDEDDEKFIDFLYKLKRK